MTDLEISAATPSHRDLRAGAHIEAQTLSRTLRGGTRILSAVSVDIEPGRLVAVIGASGSGKTTLLETLAGLRRPSSGRVLLDGWDLDTHRHRFRSQVGYVPQDDIIHRDLPVRSTVLHAARLRLPDLGPGEVSALVDRTIDSIGLSERASTVVSRLSGGQRKRVSIAVELLTAPRALFLDEPTSGLDPASARGLLNTLAGLASIGSTVVLTTHSPDDVARCDEVIVVGSGGRLRFHGTPAEALGHFGVADVADIYGALAGDAAPVPDPLPDLLPDLLPDPLPDPAAPPTSRASLEPVRPRARRGQWAVLSRRNVEVLARNRLTLAIMLGAPALVVAMFVVLYPPGAFDAGNGDPLTAVAITYWLAFAAFFFGLTYGLLQVCTEIAIVRREHHVGLGIGAYVLAKLVVLVPVLVAVNVAMVAALQLTGRLPDLDGSTTAALIGVLVMDAVAALALGLLASAAVAEPAHATLALPMLCFPAVLFGGAVVPIDSMAIGGRALSVVTSDRWAFEAGGRVLDLSSRFGRGDGSDAINQHGDAFTGGIMAPTVLLVAFAVVFVGGAVAVLRRRTAVR